MWMQIAITALILATIPLSLVWFSKGQSKYHKLISVSLFLTFDLIMFGAFTRLTDSGLGCPDWPGCYGEANPFQAHHAISAAQALMPTGPVTLSKAWIEMIHRYLAMSVGLLIVTQMAYAWWRRKDLLTSAWLPTGIFFLVCVQGAFGAWTVTLKLQPVIVTTHLLLGMALLAIQAWSLASQSHTQSLTSIAKSEPDSLIILATVALILLTLQIALGGWVSTNYAALACQDYPLCHGMLIPEMDFEHGFSLWRQLGQKADGSYLPFSALVAIHWVHRSFAWLVIIAVAVTAYLARKKAHVAALGNYLLIVIGLQFLSGVSTVFFSWPLFIAVLHNGGAALLVLLLSMLNYRLRHAVSASVTTE
ncbi:COX15/CtaA family protein [Undibacterium sp. Jales W-56]|uniref:COX15/CtaA family protein n=1 Tax=Undibacterium sp. Jales W-56 TaxID=2897325 RepID=UPI0021CEEECE|nr:COX15/CtaA family protein [Undibacterium sp. Jales W-56]MCU6435042.1 COX15/CtaA family protein [Undibacterium sp. Jales W-56]